MSAHLVDVDLALGRGLQEGTGVPLAGEADARLFGHHTLHLQVALVSNQDHRNLRPHDQMCTIGISDRRLMNSNHWYILKRVNILSFDCFSVCVCVCVCVRVCVCVCIVRPRCPSLWGSALWGPGGRWKSTELWWSKPEQSPDRSSCTGLSSPWTAPTLTHTDTHRWSLPSLLTDYGREPGTHTHLHTQTHKPTHTDLTVPAVSRISNIHCCPSTSTCWKETETSILLQNISSAFLNKLQLNLKTHLGELLNSNEVL